VERARTTAGLSRRAFLATTAGAAGTVCTALSRAGEPEGEPWLRPARHYTKQKDLEVRCDLCPRACSVADLERGYCGVRENRGGTYYTLVYARPCSIHADPIEKKPFFHCLPRARALSVATAGCNMECKFCQNWSISQRRPEDLRYGALAGVDAGPAGLVRLARRTGSAAIAYTYTEPTIFYEYMYDSAKAARKAGLAPVMVSNGYMMPKPLRELCRVLAAVKVDLKAFTETFYRDTCNARLRPVLDTLVTLKDTGVWFEIVVLVIPTLNDGPKELKACAR